jgi:hypothetical protein
VHGLHGGAGVLGLRPVAEDDQVERPQRAHEPAPEITVIAAMLDDTDGDQRVRHLQQHRRSAAQERCDRQLPRRRTILSVLK